MPLRACVWRISIKAILCLLVALYLGSAAKAAGPDKGSAFIIGISREFEALNPLVAEWDATRYVLPLVIRPIVDLDATGRARSFVLEGLSETTAAGLRSLSRTFEFKAKAVWGDGRPITGADVVASWEIGRAVGSDAIKHAYKLIEAVIYDPREPRKFTIKLQNPSDRFEVVLGHFVLVPAFLEKPTLKEHGSSAEEYRRNSTYTKDPTNPGLYYGPYLVKEFKRGSGIGLVSNATFIGQAPSIPNLRVLLESNRSALEGSLFNEKVDVIGSESLDRDWTELISNRLRKENIPSAIISKPSTMIENLIIPVNQPVLREAAVRRALRLATDTVALSRSLPVDTTSPIATYPFSFLEPGIPGPGPFLSPDLSLNRGKDLLQNAGWVRSGDGLRSKGGALLKIKILIDDGNPIREKTARWLVSRWKELGVSATVEKLAADELYSAIDRGGLAGIALVAEKIPHTPDREWLSDWFIKLAKPSRDGASLYRQLLALADPLKDDIRNGHTASIRTLQRLFADEVPSFPLYYWNLVAIAPYPPGNFWDTRTFRYETSVAEYWKF